MSDSKELKNVNNKKEVQEALDILKKCQEEAYKRMSKIIMDSMEEPLDDFVEDEAFCAYMSILVVDCLIELAKTGYDLLAHVNDKDGAIRTILKNNNIEVVTF